MDRIETERHYVIYFDDRHNGFAHRLHGPYSTHGDAVTSAYAAIKPGETAEVGDFVLTQDNRTGWRCDATIFEPVGR